jgi:putative transposase
MSCWFEFVFGLAVAHLKSRRHLLLENAALRHQLLVLSRNDKRPRWRTADRVFWVWLSLAWARWHSALRLAQPETVVHWHRQRLALFWRWKSRVRRVGRKSLAPETIALIGQMCRANPVWGAPRIHGELLKLGITVAQRTVSKYMVRQPRSFASQTWTTFLHNHLGQMVSVDFLTVPTPKSFTFLLSSHTLGARSCTST